MTLTKRGLFALLPNLAFLTFNGGGKGGGGGGRKSTTTTNKVDPAVLARYDKIFDFAEGVVANPYTSYTDQRVADFTDAQELGFDTILNASQNAGVGTLNNAINTASQSAGYTPYNVSGLAADSPQRFDGGDVSANYNVADVSAGTMGPVGNVTANGVNTRTQGNTFADYQNQYTDGVINTTLADMERQRQLALNDIAYSAQSGNAFGNSRHALAETETTRAFADEFGQISALLRDRGHKNAQTAFMGDSALMQQGALANQGAALSAAQGNQAADITTGQANLDAYMSSALANQQSGLTSASAQLQAALANQGAQLTEGAALQNAQLSTALANQQAGMSAQELNQSAGLQNAQQQQGAAALLASLSGQRLDQGFLRGQAQLDVGSQQQQREQELLNIRYGEFRGEQEKPDRDLQRLTSTFSGAPIGQTSITRSDGGGGGKIICTMMNESYGFGDFRNKLWLEQSRRLDPAIERGYHTIFLPVIAFAKGDGWMSRMARKIMEHGARHRTADIWKQKRGKRDRIGQAYRLVFEPICYVVGKLIKEK